MENIVLLLRENNAIKKLSELLEKSAPQNRVSTECVLHRAARVSITEH